MGCKWSDDKEGMGLILFVVYRDQIGDDLAGKLTRFTNKRRQEITYDYDVFGKLTKKTTPKGEIDFTYDNRDRITEIQGNDFDYRYSYGNFITGWSHEGNFKNGIPTGVHKAYYEDGHLDRIIPYENGKIEI